jgi:hypothetical protein
VGIPGKSRALPLKRSFTRPELPDSRVLQTRTGTAVGTITPIGPGQRAAIGGGPRETGPTAN